jgi:hypothetical protein
MRFVKHRRSHADRSLAAASGRRSTGDRRSTCCVAWQSHGSVHAVRDTTSRPSPRPPATGRLADPRCLGIDAAPCRGVAATSLRWSRDVGPHYAPVGVTDPRGVYARKRNHGSSLASSLLPYWCGSRLGPTRPGLRQTHLCCDAAGRPISESSTPHMRAAFHATRESRVVDAMRRPMCPRPRRGGCPVPQSIYPLREGHVARQRRTESIRCVGSTQTMLCSFWC